MARWQWLPYGEVLSDMAMEVWWQLHTKSTKEGKRSTGLLTRTTNVSHNHSSQLHSLHDLFIVYVYKFINVPYFPDI